MLFQSFHVLVNQWSISHWQCYPTGEWTWSILGSLTRPIKLQWIPGSKVWTDSESIIISNQLITPTPIQIGFAGSVVGYTDDTSPIPFIAGTLPKPWIQCIYCSTAGLFGMSRNWGRTTHRRIPFFFPIFDWMPVLLYPLAGFHTVSPPQIWLGWGPTSLHRSPSGMEEPSDPMEWMGRQISLPKQIWPIHIHSYPFISIHTYFSMVYLCLPFPITIYLLEGNRLALGA